MAELFVKVCKSESCQVLLPEMRAQTDLSALSLPPFSIDQDLGMRSSERRFPGTRREFNACEKLRLKSGRGSIVVNCVAEGDDSGSPTTTAPDLAEYGYPFSAAVSDRDDTEEPNPASHGNFLPACGDLPV